jgi:hypothetical protein
MGIFKKIQREFRSFLKNNEPPKPPEPKKIDREIKPDRKKILRPHYGPYETTSGLDSLRDSYKHQVGRIKDWYRLYGQGMYE